MDFCCPASHTSEREPQSILSVIDEIPPCNRISAQTLTISYKSCHPETGLSRNKTKCTHTATKDNSKHGWQVFTSGLRDCQLTFHLKLIWARNRIHKLQLLLLQLRKQGTVLEAIFCINGVSAVLKDTALYCVTSRVHHAF